MKRSLIIAIAFLAAFLASPNAFSDQSPERVTDEMVAQRYGRGHSVMKDQRRRMHELQDAFLTGDEESIQRNAKEIAQAMGEIARRYPPEPGKEDKQWKIMAEIIEHARRLDQAATKKEYLQAYQHFADIGASCVQCHQERRSWGKFPVPEPPAEKSKTKPASDADSKSIQ